MQGVSTAHAVLFATSHKLALNSPFVHDFYILNLIEKSDIFMDNSQNTFVLKQIRT